MMCPAERANLHNPNGNSRKDLTVHVHLVSGYPQLYNIEPLIELRQCRSSTGFYVSY